MAKTGSEHPRFVFGWTGMGLAAVVVVGVIAVVERLAGLGSVATYTFDEGVYWQTLRAMQDGHLLYRDIFHAQPPLFALLSLVTYEAGGQTIGAARLGVALISLLGIAGVAMVAACAIGRRQALLAAALLTCSPFFLRQSQTLQADAMCAALAAFSLGLAYRWLGSKNGARSSLWWAAAAGAALAASILVKLLCATVVLPILWLWIVRARHNSFRTLLPSTAAFVLVGIAVTGLVLAPFAPMSAELIEQVITFHLDAARIAFDTSTATYPWPEIAILAVAAAAGTWAAFQMKDPRVLPALLWLGGTAVTLLVLSPLWPQHLVAVVPPLIALAVFVTRIQYGTPVLLAMCALGLVVQGFSVADRLGRSDLPSDQRAFVAAIEADSSPTDLIVTDTPFLAAVTGRSVPPFLADMSTVRIRSGYLTAEMLRMAVMQQDVHAVAFQTGRLSLPELADFESTLAPAFQLHQDDGSGHRLWVR